MQKNAGAKPLRWLGKTNSQSKNSTPTGRCQVETGKFAEVNFSMQETICILYTAKPLTFCRCHAVCGGGGTDPGNVAGAALQRRHGVFRGGLQRDDGAGCGTGVMVGGSRKRNLFRNLRKCRNFLTE